MTIRADILKQLVERINALDGWTAQLRNTVNASQTAPFAIVSQVAEDKDFASSDTYVATLTVGVWVTVSVEDAHADIDQDSAGNVNPFLYLDRMVAAVEQVVHDPDAWGLDIDFTTARVRGHVITDPSEDNQLTALVRIEFGYRHQITDLSS